MNEKPDEDMVWEAFRHMDIETFRQYIGEGGNPNAKDEFGHSILSVMLSNAQMWKARVEKEGDRETREKLQHTVDALMAMSETLIRAGASDRNAYVPLFTLLPNLGPNRINMAETLIDLGANIHEKDGRGDNAIFAAVLDGDVEYVKFLVGKGAHLHERNLLDYTPLLAARACLRSSQEAREKGETYGKNAERYEAIVNFLVEIGAPERPLQTPSISILNQIENGLDDDDRGNDGKKGFRR